MRRVALALVLSGVGLLTLLCITGMLLTWSTDGHDLVMPGATNVEISGRGTARLRVTYSLPPNTRLRGLSQYLEGRGWRRITTENYDRPGPAFARLSLFGIRREVVVINARLSTRQRAEINLARCFRFAGWVTCF